MVKERQDLDILEKKHRNQKKMTRSSHFFVNVGENKELKSASYKSSSRCCIGSRIQRWVLIIDIAQEK